METKTVMRREQEEQSTQMSHSMQLSSHIKKRTFTSRCEHIPQTSAVGVRKELMGVSQRSLK